jgi:hypothetical protein
LNQREHQPLKQVLLNKYRQQLDFVTIS